MPKSPLSVYVPEINSFAQKNADPCRRLFEDCAVIDAASFCVLVSRGTAFAESNTLLALLKNKPSPDALASTLFEHPRLLLEAEKGSLLLFGDEVSNTGLLFVIFLDVSHQVVSSALCHLWRSDFFGCCDKQMHLPFGELLLLCDRLNELLFYTDRIFDQRRFFGLRPLCLSLAALLGCRLLQVDVAIDPITLSHADRARLTFYLICTLLTLRNRSGHLQIARVQRDALASALLCTEVTYSKKATKKDAAKPAFLSASCFGGVEWQENDGAMEFAFPLGNEKTALFADSLPTSLLLITLTPVENNTPETRNQALKKKAILFDLDGTILDTLEDLYLSVNYALDQNQFPIRTLEEVRRFVGNGVKNLIARALPSDVTDADRARVYETFSAYYAAHCADHTCAYEGIGELLKVLRENGFAIGVVSNKDDYAVQSLCRDYFDGMLDVTVGACEGMPKKPAPDMVQKALDALGISADEAVYIGDSEVDIATARNVGMDCISVTWGFRDRETLLAAGASTLTDSVPALLELLSQG